MNAVSATYRQWMVLHSNACQQCRQLAVGLPYYVLYKLCVRGTLWIMTLMQEQSRSALSQTTVFK